MTLLIDLHEMHVFSYMILWRVNFFQITHTLLLINGFSRRIFHCLIANKWWSSSCKVQGKKILPLIHRIVIPTLAVSIRLCKIPLLKLNRQLAPCPCLFLKGIKNIFFMFYISVSAYIPGETSNLSGMNFTVRQITRYWTTLIHNCYSMQVKIICLISACTSFFTIFLH